ncbi:hypothetical protein [Plantactinospora sp. CA-290183]|uniref:hypothetical protein n=1 Tax=Plantactinospora sp. CA-290183 TaxID=3240006 RepID=UPI003D90917B
MKTRPLAVTGLALVATLSFGVAGCNSDAGSTGGTGTGTETTPARSAADELAAAAKKLNEDTVKVAMSMSGMESSGAIDPAGNKGKMSLTMSGQGQSLKIELLTLDNDIYMKMAGMPGMPDKWMRVDASKVKEGTTLDMMPKDDASGAGNLVNSMVDVERTGEGSFTGTMDMSKSRHANAETLQQLGEKGKAIPFTAKTDAQGRLVEFTIDMSSVLSSLGQLKTTYSGFGDPVEVTKPAASEVTEAPQALLDGFNI